MECSIYQNLPRLLSAAVASVRRLAPPPNSFGRLAHFPSVCFPASAMLLFLQWFPIGKRLVAQTTEHRPGDCNETSVWWIFGKCLLQMRLTLSLCMPIYSDHFRLLSFRPQALRVNAAPRPALAAVLGSIEKNCVASMYSYQWLQNQQTENH